jgi:hypothetical protein
VALTSALVLLLSLTAIAGDSRPERRPLPSSQAIRERVAKAGPMNAVWDITQPNPEESAWPLLIDKVAAGSVEWLEVAELLAPGTDAGYSLQLRFAVTYALANEPANVLRMLDRVYSTKDICDDVNVFMDSDSYAEAAAQLSRWTSGVTGVAEPGLTKRRDACLQGLAHLEAEIRKNRQTWFSR